MEGRGAFCLRGEEGNSDRTAETLLSHLGVMRRQCG